MAKKHLKPALLSSAVAAGLMATAMPANAVKFSASGQINKVIGSIDNGDEDAVGFFDNINSGTRIRFRGSEELDNGITIGGYQEWQMARNKSSSTAFQANGEFGETGATFDERHFDIYASSGWGKISLGQGNGAANGSSEVDLSGTWQTDYVGGNQCLLGGITFGTGTTVTPATTNPTLDGESRNQRIRYDSPTLGDVFSFAASLGNGGSTELSGWLDLTFGSTQLSAAIGVSDSDDKTMSTVVTTTTLSRERTMISGSLLLGNGLNFTVSHMEQELTGDDDDNEIDYFKIGYKTGKHAVSLSVTDGGGGVQAVGVSNIEGEGTAIGYTYKAAKSLDLYASWRTLEVDDIVGAEDIDAIHGGARLTWSSN